MAEIVKSYYIKSELGVDKWLKIERKLNRIVNVSLSFFISD